MDRFNFALLCCLAVFTLNVHAANNFEYVNGRWVKVAVNSKSIQQARLSATYYHSFPNVPAPIRNTLPTNKALTVTYSGSRITQIARTARDRTPVYMAVAGAVSGAGWLIDELTGQITAPVEVLPEGSETFQEGYAWCTSPNINCASTARSSLNRFLSTTSNLDFCWINQRGSEFDLFAKRRDVVGSSCAQWISTRKYARTDFPLVPEIVHSPVTQQQLDQKIIPAVLDLPNHQIEDSLRDAHGNPRPTPELMDALRDWLSDVAGRDPNLNYDPNTNRLTYTDPNTGTQTDYEPSTPTDVVTDPTESYEPAPGSDWPDFCSWATVVCDWLEWTREFDEPEIEDMPFREVNLLDYQQDYDSGLGQGSCPAGVQYEFMGQTGSFDYTNACYVASNYFKPVLLFIGAFIAVMIIAGTNRSTS